MGIDSLRASSSDPGRSRPSGSDRLESSDATSSLSSRLSGANSSDRINGLLDKYLDRMIEKAFASLDDGEPKEKSEEYTADSPKEKESTPSTSSAKAKSKEYKDGYKLEKGDTLSKVVIDKYFDGKNPGKDKLMAKVAEVATASGLKPANPLDPNDKAYRSLAKGTEIKFPEAAKATASKSPFVASSADTTSVSTRTLQNNHEEDVVKKADDSLIVQQRKNKDEHQFLLSKEVLDLKKGQGMHQEYNSDGSVKAGAFARTEVYENNHGQIVSRYKNAKGETVYKFFKKSGESTGETTASKPADASKNETLPNGKQPGLFTRLSDNT